MIENIFINILNMSLMATVAILIVLLARVILRKAPKIFSYALWAVVLFRLLCPISFTADFSIYNLLQVPTVQNDEKLREEELKLTYIEVDASGQSKIGTLMGETGTILRTENQVFPIEDSEIVERNNEFRLTPQFGLKIASIVWLTGIILLAAYSIATLVSFRKRLSKAEHSQDNMYIAEGLTTPFVCGIFQPKIYLPSGLLEEEKRYIILHEQIHIKRGDHLIKIIGFVALCLHWFNPLVWVAFFLSGKDMEMSCDEAVIRKMGSDVKKDYSTSLLALATGRHFVNGVPLAFGEGDTGSRIKNVLRYKKPAIVVLGIVALLTVILSAALLANPAAKGDSDIMQSGFWGVVVDEDIMGDGNSRQLIFIPRTGAVEIPDAGELLSYTDKPDVQHLETGDVVRIVFPVGEEVYIQESYPARFTADAEKIEVFAKGYHLAYMGENIFDFTVPEGEVPRGEDAKVGDAFLIYNNAYLSSVQSEIIVETSIEEIVSLQGTDNLKGLRVKVKMQDIDKLMESFLYGVTYSVNAETELEVEK